MHDVPLATKHSLSAAVTAMPRLQFCCFWNAKSESKGGIRGTRSARSTARGAQTQRSDAEPAPKHTCTWDSGLQSSAQSKTKQKERKKERRERESAQRWSEMEAAHNINKEESRYRLVGGIAAESGARERERESVTSLIHRVWKITILCTHTYTPLRS
jgi:hypothetical protein